MIWEVQKEILAYLSLTSNWIYIKKLTKEINLNYLSKTDYKGFYKIKILQRLLLILKKRPKIKE